MSTRTGSPPETLAKPAPNEAIGLAPSPATPESKYDGTAPERPAAMTTLSQSIGQVLILIRPPKPAALLTSSAAPAISISVCPRPPWSRITSNIIRLILPLSRCISSSQSDLISLSAYKMPVQSSLSPPNLPIFEDRKDHLDFGTLPANIPGTLVHPASLRAPPNSPIPGRVAMECGESLPPASCRARCRERLTHCVFDIPEPSAPTNSSEL